MWFRKRRRLPIQDEEQKKYSNPYFPRQEKLPLNKTIKKEWWIYLLILFVAILTFVLVIIKINYFNIKSIKTNETKNLTTQQINDIVNKYLNSRALLISKKKNYFLFYESGLEKFIRKELKDKIIIKEINIKKEWPPAISLEIKERVPNLVWQTNGQFYYLDLEGVITQAVGESDYDKSLPVVYDQNNTPVSVSSQKISKNMVDFILEINEEFPIKITNPEIKIDSYNVPTIKCQSKKVVAKEADGDEVEAEEEDELTKEKRKIQEKFKNGEISIDESLELLDKLRKEYTTTTNHNINAQDIKIDFEEIFEDMPCDYVKTVKDIEVKTNEGWRIFFTDYLDLDRQFNNLNLTLQNDLAERNGLEYIDVRFLDRVYYK